MLINVIKITDSNLAYVRLPRFSDFDKLLVFVDFVKDFLALGFTDEVARCYLC